MIFVDPKTGKGYKNVIEAARAVICPGPCMDCPIRDMRDTMSQSNTLADPAVCTLWAYDHPTAFAERMGLVIKDSSREDMTLGEVKEMCMKRQAEFHGDACHGCVMYDPGKDDCTVCTQYTKHQTPADWKLYTGLQFNNFAERKQLNGLYDAYGPGAVIHRYHKHNLVIITGDADHSTFPLPGKWLPDMPEKSYFSLDEARKNNFVFVSLSYEASVEKAPERQPSFGPTGQPQQVGQIQQEGQ